MPYNRYTHNIIIKNPNEVLKNAVIAQENGITRIKKITGQDYLANYPKQIIIPGLINLHCHLVYTGIKTQSRSLFPWISELLKIQQMEEAKLPSLKVLETCSEGSRTRLASPEPPELTKTSMRMARDERNAVPGPSGQVLGVSLNRALAGAKQAQSFGTTYLVENSHQPLVSFQAMQETGLQGLIGIEVFGSDPSKASEIFASTLSLLDSLPRDSRIQFTLSPHASYDVSPALWKLCQKWCDEHKVPLLTHVAESLAEEIWFKDHKSPETQSAKEFWASINTLDIKLKHWQSYPSSVQYLQANNMLSSNMLITHAVHTAKTDLEILKSYGAKLISCPRSNRYLGNGLADYNLWQELGMEFGVGTDSEASNQNLDLRAEANAIPGLNAKQRFELITTKAASILKRNDLGIIQEGLNSDYITLELLRDDIDLDTCDPFELIMDTNLTKLREI